MGRTQIYLTEEENRLLDRESERTGASRSELIRRAIRLQYGGASTESRRKALLASAGVWRDRSFTGTEYVDAVRGDLNERLSKLGLR